MKSLLAILALLTLASCSQPWNDPYPAQDADKAIFYSAFSSRPKHLDPVQAYSENEYVFLEQIYQPPLQYHYLKHPYTLVPQAAAGMPTVRYYDKRNHLLPQHAPPSEIAYSVYEIHLRHDLKYQPHPALAKTPDGKLRYLHMTAQDWHGIHTLTDFAHTGTRTVTAADYVYQIKRLAHPDLHSPIFGVMAQYIVGLKQYAQTLQQARKQQPGGWLDLRKYPLPGVQVVNDTTYRIKIRGKYPQFIYWLAMPFFSPMPWEAEAFYAQPGMAERNLSLDWWPIGSGPYYLSENNPNQRMVLSRNPNFSGEYYPSSGDPGDRAAGLLKDAGKPLPLIGKAVFSLEKESIPYWNKFLQGYYDTSGISSDNFDQAVQVNVGGQARVTPAMQAQGIKLSTSVAPSTSYLGFNWLDPVVGGACQPAPGSTTPSCNPDRNRKLRQAISIAVNWEEFISIFYNGRGIAAQSPIPPGIFGYRAGKAGLDNYVYDWVDGAPQRKSIAVAKKLLAEAGYPGGVSAKTGEPLVLYIDTVTSGDSEEKARLDWLAKQFAKIDVQLVPRPTDYNRFQDKIRRGDTQMFFWGWNADYPDPENFLFLLSSDQAKVEYGGENAANYSNPEYDRLFEKMKNMDNGPARQAIIDRMLAIIHRDAPWMWGFHPKDYVLRHGWVYNSKPNKLALNFLKYLRVDPVQREAMRLKWNQPVLWPFALLGLIFAALAGWLWRALRKREEAR